MIPIPKFQQSSPRFQFPNSKKEGAHVGKFSSKQKFRVVSSMMTGWWFQIFIIFIPIWGFMIQFDGPHIFQLGWFNHQPDDIFHQQKLNGTESQRTPFSCDPAMIGTQLTRVPWVLWHRALPKPINYSAPKISFFCCFPRMSGIQVQTKSHPGPTKMVKVKFSKTSPTGSKRRGLLKVLDY